VNAETILAAVWSALNSPAGIALAAGIFLWLLNRLYAAQPTWKQFEGSIIAAVKFAEKEIPDGSSNTSLARLDAALKYMVRVYEATTGQAATPAVQADLKEGIQVTHAELEAAGTL